MGPCATALSNRSQRQLPITFACEIASSQLNSSLQHEFQFQLSNVCILPLHNSKLNLSFVASDIIKIDMLKTNMQINPVNKYHIKDNSSAYEVKWNQSNTLNFTLTQKQLAEKNLQIFLTFEAKQPIQILRLSLYLIVNGPYHHNIEINYQGENFRILFDVKISHLFETQLEVAQLNLQINQTVDASLCHFTLRALLHQSQIVTQSQPSYSLQLSKNKQIQSNISSKFFQQECPSPNNLRKINFYYGLSQQNQLKQIIWKRKEDAKVTSQTLMPSLTVDISTRQISQNSIQLIVWSNQTQNEAKYLCQARIPLWKLLQKQHTDKLVIMNPQSNKSNSVCIEDRLIKLKDKLYCHHNIIGNFEIVINMKSQKLIEQIKYCSRTEEGIVNLAPSALKKDIKSDSETIHQLWKQMEQIDQIMKKIGSNSKFQGLKSQIGLKLIKINDKLVLRKDELLYSDANKFDSLMNNQNILLTFIQKMYPFIELNQNSTLSNLSWSIILNIFKRNQFTLENLGLKGIYKTPQAKAVYNRKKDVGLKYHQAINRLIQCAINNYEMDRFSDHEITTKFLSFCFFRVIKFRECFFKSVKINKDDKLIQMQLLQAQKQMEPRTSFNNPLFKMMLDWQKYFYDELKDDKSTIKQKFLLVNLKNVKFFSEMDSRDGFFYDFVSQVLKSLPKLNAGGIEKWKYINGYTTLVSILLSEMKLKPIQKFMTGTIQTSLLLLQNEHLINILMPLICQKVNVYDITKVQIAFDLLTEFFEVLTNKKTSCLPPTFNQNYLFKIIKIFIQGEHFYNTNRILILIFNFYTLMSQLGKYQIAMYFMGSVFFKLFYHWSQDVRNIFYNILLIKFQGRNNQSKDKIKTRFTKIIAITKIIFSIHEQKFKSNNLILQKNTVKKLKNKIYDKMHQHKQSNTCKKKNQYALNIILQQCQDDFSGRSSESSSHIQGQDLRQSRTKSIIALPAIFTLPKFQTADNLPQDKKKKTLSKRFTISQEFSMVQFTPQKINEEASETFVRRKSETITENEKLGVGTNDCSGRKKRKPSLFLPTKNLSHIKQYNSTIVNELHSLCELSRDQVKNITNAKHQFNQIEKQITVYSSTHDGAFPERNFIQKNSKELAA